MGEGKGYPSFSRGEKVAEVRGRMRGLVIHKMLTKRTRIYDLAIQRLTERALPQERHPALIDLMTPLHGWEPNFRISVPVGFIRQLTD
jgi:hypothetical protein